jgi:hypothetical protein
MPRPCEGDPFDCHSGNWGYLINVESGEIELAPIYDCGSSLYPKYAEEHMDGQVLDQEQINTRILKYPTTALMVDGEKVPYRDFMVHGKNADCCAAVLRLLRLSPKIDLDTIRQIIATTGGITPPRTRFLTAIIEAMPKEIRSANPRALSLSHTHASPRGQTPLSLTACPLGRQAAFTRRPPDRRE